MGIMSDGNKNASPRLHLVVGEIREYNDERCGKDDRMREDRYIVIMVGFSVSASNIKVPKWEWNEVVIGKKGGNDENGLRNLPATWQKINFLTLYTHSFVLKLKLR